VTVNSFLADGGDRFLVLREGTNRAGGALDLDAFEAHFAGGAAADAGARSHHACELAVMRDGRGLRPGHRVRHHPRRVTDEGLNRRELERYVQRVTDRWPVQRALLGGARVADLQGAPRQRERGPEYVIVFVSEHFDGVPWLERVYQTGSLWDAYEMGAPADVHCYTPAEFERRRESLPVVRETAEHGLELLPEPA
jgi:uncharacterized protein